MGQKESPYAQSPYYTAYQTRQPDYTGPAWDSDSSYQPPYGDAPRPDRPQKAHRKMSRRFKSAIAAMLAVVIVAGSCGITAAVVNSR